jgi:hypothetical protein
VQNKKYRKFSKKCPNIAMPMWAMNGKNTEKSIGIRFLF